MVEVMGRMEVWPLLLVLFISAVEVLVLIARAQDQHPDLGFISIDCGASEAHTRETLSLQYDTDERFIRSGKNGQVASQYYSVINRELRSLRYFPDGNRNCYLLRPNQGISNRYLIRASFFHGSYDGNPETPTFDLHIDVNRWTTISLPNTSSPITKEIIYTTYRDYIHVCLVNTDSGVPFISLLELRILDDSIYGTSGPSTALKSYKRYNFGAQVTTYRYPQDPYDRIWQSDKPDGTDFTVITNTTNVDSLKSFNDAYKVPTEVLMTAVASFDSSEGLRLSLYSTSIDKWLVCLHFAEIEVLQSGQVRKLSVNVNEGPVPAEDSSVTAEYLKPITVNLTTPILTKGMNISILQKSGSDLPAFLNAAEVFTALNLSNLQTEILSVKALNDIMTRYPGVFEDEWQGDPCVPPEFTWEGLKCSYADSPRITYLNLSNKGLKGRIADAFHNLTSLESLDLSSNGLAGQLPEYLGFLPMLKFLNLSGNNFCGEIPDSLREKNSSTEFILSLSENSYHNFPCPAVPNPKKKRTAIIPVSVGVASVTLIIILCLVAGVCFCSMRKRRQGVSRGTHVTKEETTSFVNVTSSKDASATMSSEGSLGIVNKNRPFTSNEVSVITQNFKEIIGGGAFGNVYLGALDDGTKVAVKVLSPSSRQGYKEFQAEAKLLTIVHHKNLVSLIGYCDIPENLSLVYEYMSNGNLRQHLSEHAIEALSWIERLQIGIDAAQGLEYLHNGCRPPIVHRDLKTSNILLNNKMQAKIADFGLSRVLASDQDTDISTRPAGTPGYLDPMFHASGKLNKKSDVYSFGIILLELVTGHLAIIRDSKDGTHIVQWVSPLVEKGDTERIVDPRIHGQFDRNSAKKAIETAMQCVQLAAVQRPDISRVVSELKECLAIQTRSRIRQADNIRSDSFEMTYPETHMASASST